MTNREIRSWYLAEISRISQLNQQWVEHGGSLEHRARRAFQVRRDLRRRAREMMENADETTMLRERDATFYGNPDGPTFEQLVEKLRAQGLDKDLVYERILNSAQATNEAIKKLFGL